MPHETFELRRYMERAARSAAARSAKSKGPEPIHEGVHPLVHINPPPQKVVPNPLRERIDTLIARLRTVRTGVGQLPQWDEIISRRLDAAESALKATEHDVVHLAVIDQVVRQCGKLLARDRRRGGRGDGLTAKSLAVHVIDGDWLQAPPGANPYRPLADKARKELATAIDDASHKAPKTESSIRALCRKLGLAPSSGGAIRQSRYRAKRNATK